jgi:hypothetical protein
VLPESSFAIGAVEVEDSVVAIEEPPARQTQSQETRVRDDEDEFLRPAGEGFKASLASFCDSGAVVGIKLAGRACLVWPNGVDMAKVNERKLGCQGLNGASGVARFGRIFYAPCSSARVSFVALFASTRLCRRVMDGLTCPANRRGRRF